MYKSGMQSFIAAGCFISCMTGCVPALQGPAVREPNKQVAPSFPVEAPVPSGVQAQATSDAQETWREFFASPELRALIDNTLVGNQEINIRLQELVIAHNEAMARQGEYWPRLNGSIGVGLEKVGKYTSQGTSDELTQVPKNLGNFTFGLVGSWEADVWAKLRNAKKAADLRYMASVEGQKFLVTQTVAELARSYYELIALDNQLQILEENIHLQEATLNLVKLEKQAARVTELAVQRFEGELLHYKSRIYKLKQGRVQTENRINFLMGRYPQPIKRNPKDFQQLSETMGLGLPVQLLENRTDVRQAELALNAAKLDVKAAKAAFYPSLTIEAGVGYRAFNPAHLLATPASLIYDAVGGLVAPLLNRRAITAQYETANAMQVQAVFGYEQTLLHAYTDVANQLAAMQNWRDMYQLLAMEVATLAQAVDISTTLFQSARAEYIEVLTTRRDFLEAQMELVEANKKRFFARVDMYQALGGGWRVDKPEK